MHTFGGIEEAMHAFRVLLLATVGAAAVTFATTPSMAQTGDAARVRPFKLGDQGAARIRSDRRNRSIARTKAETMQRDGRGCPKIESHASPPLAREVDRAPTPSSIAQKY